VACCWVTSAKRSEKLGKRGETGGDRSIFAVGDEGKSRRLFVRCCRGLATADSARLLMALKPLHNKAKLSRLQMAGLSALSLASAQLSTSSATPYHPLPPSPRPGTTSTPLDSGDFGRLKYLIGSPKSRRFRDSQRTVDAMRESQDCIGTSYVLLVSSCTQERFETWFIGAGW
jgi:hypothetical protein